MTIRVQVQSFLPICFFVLALQLATLPSAFADGFSTAVNAGVRACTANVCDTSNANGLPFNPLQAGESFSNPDIATNATATSSGTIQYGLITGMVSASAIESSELFPPLTNLNNTSSEGFFNGFWEDTLTVTSPTLAIGTPVDLAFTLQVNAFLTCGGIQASATLNAQFQAGPTIVDETSTCNDVIQISKQITVAALVGDVIPIEGQLEIDASAVGLNGVEAGTGGAIGSDARIDPPSSQFFIDSLTPAADYVTASGTDYSTPPTTQPVPTPEPATFGLLVLGLLNVVVKSRFTFSPLSR